MRTSLCGCTFCEEIEDNFLEFNNISLGKPIIFESRNFVVVPSLGQIVEGYLLIASKKHFISIGEMPSELYPELEAVQEKVRKVLSANYGIPLFFEHGPVSVAKKGGCCVEHCHLHAVPAKIEILDELKKHFKCRKIKDFSALKRQFNKKKQYFFYESNSGQRFVFELPPAVPSQYIRKVIANKIGSPEKWDWKTCPGADEFIRTIKKLKKEFRTKS